MALFKDSKDKRDASTPAEDPGLAPSTHPDGGQSVDPKEDKVLPDSSPEEIAPIPNADGTLPKPAKPAPSSTGYRVAEGKSVSAVTGDQLDAGAEIGPQHVGGQARLDDLVKGGAVVETDKKADDKPADKFAADKPADKPFDRFAADKPAEKK